MSRLLLLVVLLFAGTLTFAKRPVKAAPEVKSKFRTDLFSIIKVSQKPGGFEQLKQVELTTGRWNCRQELDGFLPVVEANAWHPADRLQLYAVSLTPAAQKNAAMLALKGIPGYTMRDSDNDQTVYIDRTAQARKVVFRKEDKTVVSTVTLIWKAHQYNSVELYVEAW